MTPDIKDVHTDPACLEPPASEPADCQDEHRPDLRTLIEFLDAAPTDRPARQPAEADDLRRFEEEIAAQLELAVANDVRIRRPSSRASEEALAMLERETLEPQEQTRVVQMSPSAAATELEPETVEESKADPFIAELKRLTSGLAQQTPADPESPTRSLPESAEQHASDELRVELQKPEPKETAEDHVEASRESDADDLDEPPCDEPVDTAWNELKWPTRELEEGPTMALSMRLPEVEPKAYLRPPPLPTPHETPSPSLAELAAQIRDTSASSSYAPGPVAQETGLYRDFPPDDATVCDAPVAAEPLRTTDLDTFRVPRPETVLSPLNSLNAAVTLGLLEVDLTPPPPRPPGPEAWQRLADALSAFLLEQGATRAAAILPQLLMGERTDLSRLSSRVSEALASRNIAEVHGAHVRVTLAFQEELAGLRRDFEAGYEKAPRLLQVLTRLIQGLLASAADPKTLRAHLEQAGFSTFLRRVA